MELKILAGIIIVVGFAIVMMSNRIVKKFEINNKVKLEHEDEMEAEEARDYRMLKASVNVKLFGMLVALPGMVILIMVLR